jgi:hypothetical protein
MSKFEQMMTKEFGSTEMDLAYWDLAENDGLSEYDRAVRQRRIGL